MVTTQNKKNTSVSTWRPLSRGTRRRLPPLPPVVTPLHLRGAFKKFCNSTIKKNRNATNYTLFFNTTPTEFNAFATFFWQTVNSTKIEIFGLPLLPLLDSFLERFVVRLADRRSESSATWHDNVKVSILL